MNIVFAPDFTTHNPYQALLAGALRDQGSEISFLSDYRRGLPLTRGCSPCADLIHLHWPEAYFRSSAGRLANWRRALRYPFDLQLLTARVPLVLTAHNLLPHHRSTRARHNMACTYRRARRVIAHSGAAADAVSREFSVPREHIDVIPHGDFSVTVPPLADQSEAREKLSLSTDPVCLMFGGLAPYKGIEDVVRHWPRASKTQLYIVGESFDHAYGDKLERAIAQVGNATLIRKRVTDSELADWLAACDCTLFNYRQILTSGSASLARSLGIPVLLPRRLHTVDLGEPHSQVHRFHSLTDDFPRALEEALTSHEESDSAEAWRRQTAWNRIAKDTLESYSLAQKAS